MTPQNDLSFVKYLCYYHSTGRRLCWSTEHLTTPIYVTVHFPLPDHVSEMICLSEKLVVTPLSLIF